RILAVRPAATPLCLVEVSRFPVCCLLSPACDDVLEVVTFNASSWWHEVDVLGQERAWVAERAALSTTDHSWAAEPGAKAAWLELDLGTRKNVTGIITKGSSEQHDYYVTSYHVSSSRDGKNWRPYRGSSGQEDKVGMWRISLSRLRTPASGYLATGASSPS
ncbi:hypothetical protein EK904_014838, partial [Melospiza melodia maxima]